MHDRQERLAWFKSEILCHESELRRYLRKSSLARADIDDLVAECLTRVYAATEWRSIANGRSYLFRVCRNIRLDEARRAKVVAFDSIADLDVINITDSNSSVETVLNARDELRILQCGIDGLPPKCREVYLLRRVHELPLADIASRLGISVKTVEAQLTKALAELTRILAEADPGHGSRTVIAWRQKQIS